MGFGVWWLGWGGLLPWAAADSSRRLYPEGWSHTDRATYDRDSGGPYRVRVVDVDVLAGRGVGWLPWAAADTAPSSVNEPLDAGRLWGGLIGYKPSYTTSARKESSGARPPGNAPKKQISVKRGVVGRGPPTRRRRRWTPERHNYENQGYFGVLGGT